MNTRRSAIVWAAVLGWLLVPAVLPSQTPAQPGKLIIKSTPVGASILINGRKMPQATDATFVVSAGTYKVSVTDGGSLKSCATKNVQVSSGSQALLYCTATGWTPPPAK